MKAQRIVALTLLAAGCTSVQQPPAQPAIAITVDDLPLHGPIPPGETPLSVGRGVIAAITDARVPAHGFVNAHWVAEQPATRQMLVEWRAAGLPLGNHGWAHRHLNEMSFDEFERELVRNEPLLAELAGGTDWRWFRYPFLDEGEDAEKREGARRVLARHGYKIAAVTMDFSDWAWTAPYARCAASNDQQAIARLESTFLAAARESMPYYRTLSRRLYGRDLPYVLLLHGSAFEARMLPRLIQLYRSSGFRFISLEEAQRDPAYADQVRPNLPAEQKGLENKATARGISLPARTDYSAELAAICPGGPTAPSP
jgi:peptidoglycan-N-acetylglucosamine deacetylase